MTQIQTKQCLHCNQNKEGLTFEVPIVDSQPTQFITKHYCWSDLEDLMKKELNNCGDWERNKKKLFKEWLIKCQQHKTFDWPWRERSWGEYSETTWKINTICVQCNVNLYWDVTSYEDSKHVCTYCSNCNSRIGIEEKTQNKHFYWNEKNLPVYKCEKKDSVKPSKYFKQANCMDCDTSLSQENKLLSSYVSDYGSIYSRVNVRPNAKAHCIISTKRHVDDFRGVSKQEWDDILPVLKDTTKKIDKVYKPLGYLFSIPVGKLGGQNHPHFYARVVPKFLINYGSECTAVHYIPAEPQQVKKVKQALQPNAENIIAEKSKVVAKLYDDAVFGYTTITTKQYLSSEIATIDSETWSQVGEICKELMEKFETKLDCHGFYIIFVSGKKYKEISTKEKRMNGGENIEDGKLESLLGSESNQLNIIFLPRYGEEPRWGGRWHRPLKKSGKGLGSTEAERISEKLRDPEAYYEKWKGDRNYLKHKAERRFWKQPQFYLTFAAGVGITLLVLGIVWIVKMLRSDWIRSIQRRKGMR